MHPTANTTVASTICPSERQGTRRLQGSTFFVCSDYRMNSSRRLFIIFLVFHHLFSDMLFLLFPSHLSFLSLVYLHPLISLLCLVSCSFARFRSYSLSAVTHQIVTTSSVLLVLNLHLHAFIFLYIVMLPKTHNIAEFHPDMPETFGLS